ncbi:formamidopyrimidine-DNA glycosylase, partial [Bordetella holmesii]|nr:formamidopyrimidine-DNA glycosylase [Bordetella holmesii]
AIDEATRKHYHVDWVLDHEIFRLQDPRRIGPVIWNPAETGPVETHHLLIGLRIDRLDQRFKRKSVRDQFRGHRLAYIPAQM